MVKETFSCLQKLRKSGQKKRIRGNQNNNWQTQKRKLHSNQYEHSILWTWTRSLRIPLYKAILFAGISLLQNPSIFLLPVDAAAINFLCCSFLYSCPSPLVSLTFSANCTFFFLFLSFFFPSTWPKINKTLIQSIKKHRKKKEKLIPRCTWRQARTKGLFRRRRQGFLPWKSEENNSAGNNHSGS